MRYIPNSEAVRREMLRSVGLAAEDLFAAIPGRVRLARPLDLPEPLDEPALAALLSEVAGANAGGGLACVLGGGAYSHYIPSVVRHLVGRSEFYTSYTPYQPEISQGTLQAIFEYQSMICALSGLDVANASLYDGASAAAEAVLMARRLTGRSKVVVSGTLHPHYRRVVETYLQPGPGEILEAPRDASGRTDYGRLEELVDGDTACFVVQSPNFLGVVEDPGALRTIRSRGGALLVAVITEPLSMALLAPPADWGADVLAAEGQSFGNPLGYGGPYLGIMAARESCLRQMPGRLVGETVDARGERGYVLTLATREQHIRRERATSNICSNEGLCALAAAVYLAALGPAGLREVAGVNVLRARRAMDGLRAAGRWDLPFSGPVFNEFVAVPGAGAARVQGALRRAGFTGGLELGRFFPELGEALLFCCTETLGEDDVERFLAAAGGAR